MEIYLSISGASAEEIRATMRDLIGEGETLVVGNETTNVDVTVGKVPEPEIVAPAKKPGRPKKAKADTVIQDDVTDAEVVEETSPPKATTEPPSLGPKHDEVRAVAREFNTKFGGDELLALLKSFDSTGARAIFQNGHADAFIEKAKARLAEVV